MSGVTVTERAVSSFDEFVASRGSALWRSAWLLTGDNQLAEDLVQAALGKSWPAWDRVSANGSFEAYVRRIMYTTYVAWWRRRWNGEKPTGELPERAETTEGPELRHDLLRALETLPKGQRAAVVLRYFEDLTERETAEALGCSIGTVKSQTARGLAALRASPVLRFEEES